MATLGGIILGEGHLKITPDYSGLGPAIKKGVEGPLKEAGEEAGTRFSEGFKDTIKELAASVGIVFATDKVIEFFKSTIEQASEAAKMARLTEAAIRSTGGAANVTAPHIEELAGALSRMTGVEDDTIKSAENMLLTFTRVRNEVGEGNDIFDQASVAIQNVSAGMHEDLQSATIQVGKALQDPVVGMTALRRIGISLDATQQAQVKTMVKSNDLMGAQKVILGELTKEFGGAAAAMADPAKRAAAAWAVFKEEIGGKLLPILNVLFGWFSGLLPAAMESVSEKLDKVREAIAPIVEKYGPLISSVFGLLVSQVRDLLPFIGKFLGAAYALGSTLAAEVVPPIAGLALYLGSYLAPALRAILGPAALFLSWLSGSSTPAVVFRTIIEGIGAAFILYRVSVVAATIANRAYAIGQLVVNGAMIAYRAILLITTTDVRALTVAQLLLDAAMDANPIGLVVIAIGLLIAAIVLIIKYHKTLAEYIVRYWNDIWAWTSHILSVISAFIASVWTTVYENTVRFFQSIRNSVVDAWNSVYDGTARVLSAIGSFVSGVWHAISSTVATVLSPAIHLFQFEFETAFAIVKLVVQVAWSIILIIFTLIKAQIEVLVAVAEYLWRRWTEYWGGVAAVVTSAWNVVKGRFIEIYDWVYVRLVAGINFWRAKWEEAWVYIRAGFEIVWFTVRRYFDELVNWLAVRLVGPITTLERIWSATWLIIRIRLDAVWAGIRAIFFAIADYVSNTLPQKFRDAAAAIGRFWNGVVAAVKAPIKIVIDTVINGGIIRGLNWVTSHLGIKAPGVPIDEFHPPGFAEGGAISGPGTGTSDSIWAMVRETGQLLKVSNGEYVLPKRKVDEIGVDNLDAWIGKPAAKYPGDGSAGIAFASGGIIGAISGIIGDAVSLFGNPSRLFRDAVEGFISRIPGAGGLRNLLVGASKKAVGWAESWLGGKVKAALAALTTSTGGAFYPGAVGNVAAAQTFLRNQDGRPYGWAMAGPAAYDCSGILSAVWNVLHGRNPFSHTFSTMDEARYFPLPGLGGVLSAAWTNPGEHGVGSDVGHTMGILNGMPFESTGGRGVHMGSGVTAPSRFAHMGHLARGGLIGMDSGFGLLQPGLNLVHNGTGRTEAASAGPIRLDDYSLARIAQILATRPNLVQITGPDWGFGVAGLPL